MEKQRLNGSIILNRDKLKILRVFFLNNSTDK